MVDPVRVTPFVYSPEGELRRVTDSRKGTVEFRYDAAHRLVAEIRAGSTPLEAGGWAERHYEYDPAGNLLSMPATPRMDYIEGNRLAASSSATFVYNHRNHLVEQHNLLGTCTRYHYDSMDMLVKVEWSDREEVWTAEYDGLCRRIAKTLGGRRTEYWWDGDRPAAELGPDGRLRLYVYANEEAFLPFMFVDYASVDAEPVSGKAYFVFYNQVGLAEWIEDEAGKRVWWAEDVEPYGWIAVGEGNVVGFDLRFPGHYFDPETVLHYNRFRYYSPVLGRYLQSDPKGQSGGINLYAYPANPLVWVDVLGLECGHKKSDTGNVPCHVCLQNSEQQIDCFFQDKRTPSDDPTNPESPSNPPADLANRIAEARVRSAQAVTQHSPNSTYAVGVNGTLNGWGHQGGVAVRRDDLTALNAQYAAQHLGLDLPGGRNDPRHQGGELVPRRSNNKNLPLVDGGAAASHAEQLVAIADGLEGKNEPIGVSRQQCGSCRRWFREHAQQQQQTYVVADPKYTRVYYPDGQVQIYDENGALLQTVGAGTDPSATISKYTDLEW